MTVSNSSAGVCASGAGVCFLGVGVAHQFTVAGNGVFTFQNLHHDRSGDHEFDQVVEERTLAMNRVKTLGILARKLLHTGGNNLQTALLKAAIYLADDIFCHRIRFYN